MCWNDIPPDGLLSGMFPGSASLARQTTAEDTMTHAHSIVTLAYLMETLFKLELLRLFMTLVPHVIHEITLVSNSPAFRSSVKTEIAKN